MTLLEVNIKSAAYESSDDVLKDISFSLKEGEIIGLIGPNGAGKSTTIKSILGLMREMSGEITFKEGSNYSYLPERPIFYDELTLWEHLNFISAVEGLDHKEYQENATKLLEMYRLIDHAHHLPNTYSKGMQQKAMLLLALITRPEIYIIDEPFIGLDPHAMKLFLNSIEEEKRRGAGIIMSTHVLDTAEKVCDRFLLVNDGKLTASGTLEEIRKGCKLPKGSLFDCFHYLAEESQK